MVGNMPCLHFQFSIDRGRDLLDAERLRLHSIGWLGKDDIPLLQHFRMDAIRRADQLQLIASVSLFCHGTGLCVCHLPDAVMVEFHFSGII